MKESGNGISAPWQPRIIFFDIDGTLLPFGEDRIRPAVAEALTIAHGRGIRLFIATGRAPFALPDLGEIPFDGVMCFNGSYSFDQDGPIYSEPMDPLDVKTVIRNAEEMGFPVTIATATRFANNFYQEDLARYLALSHQEYIIPPDYVRMQDEPVYQLMAGTPAEYDELLLRGAPHSTTARWWDRAVDIIPRHCGKGKGIDMILRHYGIPRADSMAFGDGGNDADMLSFAGVGVAMGNTAPETKAIADHVTDSCDRDGVLTAFRHFGLIPPSL